MIEKYYDGELKIKNDIHEYDNLVNAYKIATGMIPMSFLEGVEDDRTFDYIQWYLDSNVIEDY